MQAPYFIIPDIEAFATADPQEKKRLARRIAANVGSEEALRRIFGVDPAEFTDFYPDMQPPELTTEDTIDSFLDRYAPQAKTTERAADPTSVIPVAPAIDYAAMLESGTLPDVTPKEAETSNPPKIEEQSPKELTMEDFRQAVAKRDYETAREIITDMNLKNPKKSIYFAYQIRFLEKLIENQQKGRLQRP